MSEMPLEPQLAKMLLIAPEYSCSNEVRECVCVYEYALRPVRARQGDSHAVPCFLS